MIDFDSAAQRVVCSSRPRLPLKITRWRCSNAADVHPSMSVSQRACVSRSKAFGNNHTSNQRGREFIDNSKETPVPWFVQKQTRHDSDTANQVLHDIHAFLRAVIFKGSCVPLYSSPRTTGTNTPDLVLLICG